LQPIIKFKEEKDIVVDDFWIYEIGDVVMR